MGPFPPRAVPVLGCRRTLEVGSFSFSPPPLFQLATDGTDCRGVAANQFLTGPKSGVLRSFSFFPLFSFFVEGIESRSGGLRRQPSFPHS